MPWPMGAFYRSDDPFMASNYTSTTSDYWPLWSNQATATNSTVIWHKWYESDITLAYHDLAQQRIQQQEQQIAAMSVRTAQEIAAADARYAEARLAAQKRAERAEAAQKRAETLLERYLTPLQWKHYKETGVFHVCGKSGSHYRIHRGFTHNIIRLNEKGHPLHSLCAHVSRDLPEADNLVTQLFMLKHHEDEFLRVANRSPV